MWRRLILISFILLLILAGSSTWLLFRPATDFPEKTKHLYIRSDRADYNYLLKTLNDSNYISHPGLFDFLGRRAGLPAHIRPGRYAVKKGMNLLQFIKMLKNGRQDPVNLTITKLRTKENLAALAGRKLECDSSQVMAFLENDDSLRHYGLDSNTIMTLVFPNTYTYFWNSSPSVLLNKLRSEHDRVWNDKRKEAASRLGLTPAQVYILASIIEEETNASEEKGEIASVYLNRLRKGMRLQADPTVKFALREFGLKRIYEKHLAVESPYNTYRVAGLPPGPICTPSLKTLDAVLQAPETDYLYFVARSDFSGRHVFSATYREHLKYAREFQEALNKQEEIRKAREDIGRPQ